MLSKFETGLGGMLASTVPTKGCRVQGLTSVIGFGDNDIGVYGLGCWVSVSPSNTKVWPTTVPARCYGTERQVSAPWAKLAAKKPRGLGSTSTIASRSPSRRLSRRPKKRS